MQKHPACKTESETQKKKNIGDNNQNIMETETKTEQAQYLIQSHISITFNITDDLISELTTVGTE